MALNRGTNEGEPSMKPSIIAPALYVLALIAVPALGAEPDELILPAGFHASVVAENLGDYTRHMAFRDVSHLYVSTEPQTKDAANQGIMALHLDARHHADSLAHFSTIHNGTAIAVYKGALYTSSPTTLYRFKLSGKELVPTAKPEIVIDGIPGRAAIAFDGKGNLFVAIGGGGNVCAPDGTPRTSKSVGPDTVSPARDKGRRVALRCGARQVRSWTKASITPPASATPMRWPGRKMRVRCMR